MDEEKERVVLAGKVQDLSHSFGTQDYCWRLRKASTSQGIPQIIDVFHPENISFSTKRENIGWFKA